MNNTAKILILTGKSGTGKDTVLHELEKCGFVTNAFVSTTTRPKRINEKDGIDYYFVTDSEFQRKIADGYFIEYRSYNTTVAGKPAIWHYGSPKVQLRTETQYAIVLDIKGAEAFAEYYGRNNCYIVYIDVPDSVRKQRAIQRGSFDAIEWQRRLIDDAQKFDTKRIQCVCNQVVDNTGFVCDTVQAIINGMQTFFGKV